MLDTEVKKKRPYGKMNIDKVIEGVVRGMHKVDIAPLAGSQATRDCAKIDSVSRAQKTEEYKEKTDTLLEKLNKERSRILDKAMEKDLGSVDHSNLIQSLERVNKISELLEGKPTERIESTEKDLIAFLNVS